MEASLEVKILSPIVVNYEGELDADHKRSDFSFSDSDPSVDTKGQDRFNTTTPPPIKEHFRTVYFMEKVSTCGLMKCNTMENFLEVPSRATENILGPTRANITVRS